ncbi:hypothetical protein BCR43DRAFT_80687 [Syncephalastrum racemosum]|uniref:C2H2-type domain-containing protein n=1 Tax=Syncephalastrum racemosum TaxID=13706 RepID=A0A1X2H2Y6_SYNRA|nr:hypothetical protein BCR43DRAFT_80687 [Syncephalastrum racemosum]
MLYTPTKVIYKPSDSFFDEGNIALRAYWLQRDSVDEHSAELIREEAARLTKDYTRTISCELSACRQPAGTVLAFPSIAAYEAHYEARHRNVCTECQRVFPSFFFLQLHIDEIHNVIMLMQKERGEKIYRCYVETCTKHFMSPKMRRLHLIDKHKYPRTYPFALPLEGNVSFEDQRANRRHRARAPMTDPLSARARKSTDSAMDVDQLASQMSRLTIPQSISFGHETRPGFSGKRPKFGSVFQKEKDLAEAASTSPTMIREENDLVGLTLGAESTRPRRKRGPKKKKAVMEVDMDS